MVLQHRAGEKLYIDFAGKKLSYIDIDTGEIIACQVFVACLPYVIGNCNCSLFRKLDAQK